MTFEVWKYATLRKSQCKVLDFNVILSFSSCSLPLDTDLGGYGYGEMVNNIEKMLLSVQNVFKMY